MLGKALHFKHIGWSLDHYWRRFDIELASPRAVLARRF
jgi:hypothetical protein